MSGYDRSSCSQAAYRALWRSLAIAVDPLGVNCMSLTI